jgi:uncharacterized GH25 family protein
MFTIQVYDEKSGKPCKNVGVSVSFDGLMRGTTEYIYTDNKGEAHFDYKGGSGSVYVSSGLWMSKAVHSGYISGRVTVYV